MEKKKIKKVIDRSQWRTTKKERICYYIGDLGRALEGSIITSFMTLFLLFRGVDLVKVAGAILFVKIIDAVDDVVFGFFVDKIDIKKSKLLSKICGEGRYLPWYRATFFLFPLFTILFFLMPSSLSEAGKIIWFVVTYLLYDLSYTIVEVPMNSMIVSLTDNLEERNEILQTKGILASIGVILVGVIWTFLISETFGFSMRMVAIISSIIFFFMMLLLATSVKEHNTELKNVEKPEETERYTFKDMIECVKTNKYMFFVLLSTFIYGALQTGSSIGTYASYYLYGSSTILVIPIAIAFIPSTIAQLNTTKFVEKWGKRKVYLTCALVGAIIYSGIYFAGYNNFTIIVVLLVLQAAPGNVSNIAKSFMTPDTIEYTRYKTGKDCSGIFYSLNAFVNKMTTSVASSLGLFILGLSEWIPVEAESFEELAALGIQQPQSALNVLWIVYMLIPAIGTILAILVMIPYKLDEKDVKLMAKCNAGEISREECEAQLSQKY